MLVLFVGRKRDAGEHGDVCDEDALTLEPFQNTQLVVVFKVGTFRYCYDLKSLATWFLQDPVARKRLPTLPLSRDPVPSRVYRRIIRDAHLKVNGFRTIFRSITSGLSQSHKRFVLVGVERRTAAAQQQEELNIDDILTMISDDDVLPSVADVENALMSMSGQDLEDIFRSL